MTNLNFATLIESMSDALNDAPAIYFGDRVMSWREYDDEAARLANALSEAGLGKESKVGLLLYNCAEYMVGALAAFKLRGVSININYRYSGDELQYLLEDSEAEALVFHSSLSAAVEDIRDKLSGLKLLVCVDDDGRSFSGADSYADIISSKPAMERIERSPEDTHMLYTGGTTGMPKGVEYNIGVIINQFLSMAPMYFGIPQPETLEELIAGAKERAETGTNLVSMPASPLMHTAGMMNSGMLVQTLGGALAVLASRSFDAQELWEVVEKRKAAHLVIVGDTFAKPMLKVLADEEAAGVKRDLTSLKTIVSSGVIFSQQSKLDLLERLDLQIIDAVGATEGGMAMQLSSRSLPPTKTARFMAMPTTEIFSEDYQKLPRGCGEPGLIGMSGTLPRGYYRDDVKTEKTFKTIDGVRYGFSGDMGSIEQDGTMVLLGRGSGCINTGGEKVYPEEVEEELKRHPTVTDCLVAGVPDDRFGERVSAVVSLSQPLNDPLKTLMDFAAERLARYKLPRRLLIVEQVPRMPNGKADYKKTKRLLEEKSAECHTV